ncbi:hypothetical protein [Methylobacterium sp. WL19]|uniref:hypothetical protein n=1 Tax=Methylobacterium sp. WL19 TaxID=2603896 RepID=UPI0011CC68D8|nr:hypothetical protein [Methylobacterium sp. WL19]TXN22081.1 hypothetical protein FV220_22410 [Methylobacterium sp. WL19]
MKKRIPLGPDYHAEPGETKGHQHDVYTTKGELHGYTRIHVGTLMKSAVEDLAVTAAWATDEQTKRHAAEEKLLAARSKLEIAMQRLRTIGNGLTSLAPQYARAGLLEIEDVKP